MLLYTSHARSKMQERGVSEEEVIATVREGASATLEDNRLLRRKVFTMGYQRRGRSYSHKEVTVIYTEEGEHQVIVTVLARYGRWEQVQ